MANVSVYNMEGKEVGKMELNDAVFGVEINEHLVHMAVVQTLANKRQGTQKAKTRSEVSGGGRKPWRQKGTGHARQGSTGACSSPSKVFKGKGMPGHLGCVKVTVQNLTIVRVDADKNLILVKGSVPGPRKALVTIKETTKVSAK